VPGSGVRFGLAKARDAIPFLPLTAFFEHLEALESLKYVTFAPEGSRRAKTAML
jgi:hypothetical protein